jgi:hypothetical protein
VALKLSHLAANVRELAIDFAGEKINFAYRPAEVTPTFADVFALTRALVRWDVMDDRGEGEAVTVPLTEQGLTSVPIPVLRAVYDAIIADVSLGEAFRATSKAG